VWHVQPIGWFTMKPRSFIVTGISAALFVSSVVAGPSASAKRKKPTKPKSAKGKSAAAAPSDAAPTVAAGQRNFTCTGSESSRLTEFTVTGTVDSEIVMTNVTVTKNYVEEGGVAVSQPTVVMTSARPKLTTPRESFEKFVVYVFNEVPKLATAADVGKYAYGYRINFPDKILPEPEFWAVIIVEGYLAKEGTLANDQRWDTTKAVIASATCKFVS
jgi:hypothetical protein